MNLKEQIFMKLWNLHLQVSHSLGLFGQQAGETSQQGLQVTAQFYTVVGVSRKAGCQKRDLVAHCLTAIGFLGTFLRDFCPLCNSKTWRWVCKSQRTVYLQKTNYSLQSSNETNQKEDRQRGRERSALEREGLNMARDILQLLFDQFTWEPCLVPTQHNLLSPSYLVCPSPGSACRKFACPAKRK